MTLAVAVILGILAVFLVKGYLDSAAKPVVAAGPASAMTPVVVVATPILRGQPITAEAVKVVDFPVAAAPLGAFHSIAEVSGVGATARLAMHNLAANEPILAQTVTAPGGKLILSATLAPGMRAIGIKTSDLDGVAGFILPGDHVDVFLRRAVNADNSTRGLSSGPQFTTHETIVERAGVQTTERTTAPVVGQGADGAEVVQSLAENLLVLAIDQHDDGSEGKPIPGKVMTVQVTPAQAQRIALAQNLKEASVTFTLRSVSDEAPLARKLTTDRDLGLNPRPPRTIRVVRGVESTEIKIK